MNIAPSLSILQALGTRPASDAIGPPGSADPARARAEAAQGATYGERAPTMTPSSKAPSGGRDHMSSAPRGARGRRVDMVV